MLQNGYHPKLRMIKRNQPHLELLIGLVVGKDTKGKVKMELNEQENARKTTVQQGEMNLAQEILLHQILVHQVQSIRVCLRKLFMSLEVQEGRKQMLLKTINLDVRLNLNQKLILDQNVKVVTPGQNVILDRNVTPDLSVADEIIVMTVQIQEIKEVDLKEILGQIEELVIAGMITIVILTEVTEMVEVIDTMMMIMRGQAVVAIVGAGVVMAEEATGAVITERIVAVEGVREVEVVVQETDFNKSMHVDSLRDRDFLKMLWEYL